MISLKIDSDKHWIKHRESDNGVRVLGGTEISVHEVPVPKAGSSDVRQVNLFDRARKIGSRARAHRAYRRAGNIF